ncbi:MAG: hypothetical protein JWQ73_3526 [Variovorax sp.]|jgi:hypothetical protein|nr:hypothetical protein [Variovorax sp.]
MKLVCLIPTFPKESATARMRSFAALFHPEANCAAFEKEPAMALQEIGAARESDTV